MAQKFWMDKRKKWSLIRFILQILHEVNIQNILDFKFQHVTAIAFPLIFGAATATDVS